MLQSRRIILALASIFAVIFCLKFREMKIWNATHLQSYSVSTADAHHWLKEAHLREAGEADTLPRFKIDLLPMLISALSKNAEASELKRAANLLIPISVALSALAVAILAAAGSKISLVYLWVGFFSMFVPAIFARTLAGYIDTDMLNLFFVYATSASIYFMASAKKTSRRYQLCALAGVLNLLFFYWYHQPFFALAFLGAIIASLRFKRVRWRETLRLASLFLVLSIPSLIVLAQQGTSKLHIPYIMDKASTPELVSRLEMVNELQKVSLLEIPLYVFSLTISPQIGILLLLLSLGGLGIWIYRDLLKLFAFGPLLLTLLLSVSSGARFTFYSAPLLWIGLTCFLVVLSEALLHKLKYKKTVPVLMIFLVGVWLNFRQMSCVRVGSPCHTDLLTLIFPTREWLKVAEFFSSQKLTKADTLLASWDYGYFLNFSTTGKTVDSNDGVGTKITNYYTDALLDHTQDSSSTIFQALARPGAAECADKSRECLQALAQTKAPGRIFLILDYVNLQKLPRFSSLSLSSERRDAGANDPFFWPISCESAADGFRCSQSVTEKDLASHIKTDGKNVLLERKYSSGGDLTLVEMQTPTGNSFALVKDTYFKSTAGQLWLGLEDKRFFQEVYNEPFQLKVFELRTD